MRNGWTKLGCVWVSVLTVAACGTEGEPALCLGGEKDPACSQDRDGDGHLDRGHGGSDCDDQDPNVHPGASERCNGIDDNCEAGLADEPSGAHVNGRSYASPQEALKAVPTGGTVFVCPGEYVANLAVDGDVVIEGGAGPVVLDGQGVGPVVRALSGELTLRGLTLRNGLGAGEGLTRGGGLLAEPGVSRVSLTDVAIEENLADEGAGIWAMDADVHLERVRFRANVATAVGGGLMLVGEARSAELDAVDCVFEQNTAAEGAGALFATGANVSVRSGVFLGNATGGIGGALAVDSGARPPGLLRLADVSLRENQAQSGGAVWAEGVDLEVQNGVFEGNRSGGDVGAVYVAPPPASDPGWGPDVSLASVTFRRNRAVGHMGALWARSSRIELADVTFQENRAARYGAALMEVAGGEFEGGMGELDLSQVHFVDNHAPRDAAFYFAGFSVAWAGGTIEGHAPYENGTSQIAVGAGQGERTWTPCEASIRDIRVVNNHTGGTQPMSSSRRSALNLIGCDYEVTNSLFRGNRSNLAAGGALSGVAVDVSPGGAGTEIVSPSGVLRDSEFVSNAANWGGGFHHLGANLRVDGCTFERNHAELGAGLYLAGWRPSEAEEEHVMTLVGSNVRDNDAQATGGGLYHGGGHLEVLDSVFEANTAAWGGGVAFTMGTRRWHEIVDGVFRRNEARVLGGALVGVNTWEVDFHDAQLTVTRTDFGEGDADNIPDDLFESTDAEALILGDDLSFTCELAVHDCANVLGL